MYRYRKLDFMKVYLYSLCCFVSNERLVVHQIHSTYMKLVKVTVFGQFK